MSPGGGGGAKKRKSDGETPSSSTGGSGGAKRGKRGKKAAPASAVAALGGAMGGHLDNLDEEDDPSLPPEVGKHHRYGSWQRCGAPRFPVLPDPTSMVVIFKGVKVIRLAEYFRECDRSGGFPVTFIPLCAYET